VKAQARPQRVGNGARRQRSACHENYQYKPHRDNCRCRLAHAAANPEVPFRNRTLRVLTAALGCEVRSHNIRIHSLVATRICVRLRRRDALTHADHAIQGR
jgi:hypothetical protein